LKAPQNIQDITFESHDAPLAPAKAWEIESFLLKIFEYGDYSFRSALTAAYHKTFKYHIHIARHQDKLIAAAAAIISTNQYPTAIVAPIAVHHHCRNLGIATKLIENLLQHLHQLNTTAAYIAAKPENRARKLYQRLGFKPTSGIVMKYEFQNVTTSDIALPTDQNSLSIRPALWSDYPAISALMVSPHSTCCLNYTHDIYSAAYFPVNRFLSLFPKLFKTSIAANVIETGPDHNIVGFCSAHKPTAQPKSHIIELDFFTCDDFQRSAARLVQTTLNTLKASAAHKIICKTPDIDTHKHHYLEQLNFKRTLTEPDALTITSHCHNLHLYELSR